MIKLLTLNDVSYNYLEIYTVLPKFRLQKSDHG